jgi:ABC-type lipoprotein export system ATPase subunit
VGRGDLKSVVSTTGNLDSRTTIEVCALFRELNELGLTILVVTHEPDGAVRQTDRRASRPADAPALAGSC